MPAKMGRYPIPRAGLRSTGQSTPLTAKRTSFVQWHDVNGPAAQPPGNEVFDRTIVERRLPEEIGAEASLEFTLQGVRARIAVPMAGGLVVEG
jgi:hypothetical protein